MIIYKITNNKNSKIYIGFTRFTLEKRLAEHVRDSKNKPKCILHKAINKYGISNFTIEILEKVNSIQECLSKEVYYIALYNATDRAIGYNMTIGGERGPVMLGSDNYNFGKKNDALTTLNKSRTGKRLSDKHKEKISKAGKGRHHSEVTKARMSNTRKNLWKSGIYSTEDYKQKISKAHKGRPSKRKKAVKINELDLVFSSVAEAAKYVGGVQSNVSSVLTGKLKRYKGYTYSYTESKES